MRVTVTKDDITRALRHIGVASGDVLLVHSSLSALGYVEGGANAVIDALLEAVGTNGTVMVPTITGRPEHGPDCPPEFDVRHSASWTGIVPETFRRRPDALRSLHPTHSVAAIGPKAAFLVANHERSSTPCGRDTPYGRLVSLGGKVLLLGVDHNRSTLFHHVEEEASLAYHLQVQPVVARVTGVDGVQEETPPIYLHDWSTPRDFNRLEPALINGGAELVGTVGKAPTRLIDAARMVEIALAALAKDPSALLPAGYTPRAAVGDEFAVPIKRLEEGRDLPLPAYATAGSSGMDLRAAIREPMVIMPGRFALVPVGISIALPAGYEGQIRPRSGLAAKAGVTTLNSPGTVDSDYRGPIQVVLANHGSEPFTVNRGDRIAQLVIAPVARIRWEEREDLPDTERGEGGFGHTGV